MYSYSDLLGLKLGTVLKKFHKDIVNKYNLHAKLKICLIICRMRPNQITIKE